MKNFIVHIVTIAAYSIVMIQCSGPVSRLERALQAAGSNRHELEQVLYSYSSDPADSLKYRAAVFLIENMPGHSYYEGEQLDRYLEYYPVLRTMMQAGKAPQAAVDSIIGKYGIFDSSKLNLLYDVATVDSAYLCNNIEWAFKVWHEQPWGKNIPFEDFCEYILPYRVGNETLPEWREKYYKKYNGLLDTLRTSQKTDKEDPLHAALCIINSLLQPDQIYFTTTVPADLPHVGPDMAEAKSGTCREMSDFVLYVCRALGIPCAVDYMPVRGNDNVGHFWVTLWDKTGELYFQEFGESPQILKDSHIIRAPKAKVYRSMYGSDLDMTEKYSDHFLKSIEIPSSAIYSGRKPETIYLCMHSRSGWIPVDSTYYRRNHIEFNNICGGNVFRLASKHPGKIRFQSDPFYLGCSGDLHFFKKDKGTQDITVFAKFPPAIFNSRMSGGVFEGSNDISFRQKDTLFVIDNKPVRLFSTANITDTAKYRYIRYFGPNNGYCNVAELAFYDKYGSRLQGKPIGTSWGKAHDYHKAFDGTTLTSFDDFKPSGGWAGMDFGKAVTVSEIIYSPRNYDNYVREGDRYELFYCDGIWKSAGQAIASSDSLVFHDVPAGTLYLLKNHSRGVQERAFAYENGKQLWDREIETVFQAREIPEEKLHPSIARMSYEKTWEGHYTYTYPGTGWEKPDYNASAWRYGKAAFGTANLIGVNTLFLTKDIWVRRRITFDPKTIHRKKLFVRFSHDDDFQLYINGLPVISEKGWQTDATAEIPDSIARTMVNGEALLAAHCRNFNGDSMVDFGIYIK